MNPAISLVYATHRCHPAFEWLADGLARQLDPDDELEVIVVDGLHGPEREEYFGSIVGGRFPVRHVPAKPTPFNGPHQRTTRPLFAAASARNTGIVHARHPFVVFVDDCAVPMPGWWAEVREAARHQYVVGGAYQKHQAMQVSDGVLVSSASDGRGIDSRWEQGDDERVVPLPGSQLYGCSLGVPRELLVAVNGFDELCDGIGGEDYHLGVRLELGGHRLFYSRRMLTIESTDHSSADPVKLSRVDPVTNARSYMDRLAGFGVGRRSSDGAWDASHMIVDVTLGLRQPASLGNHYRLDQLVPADLPATAFSMPAIFWFDGRPLEEL